MAKLLDDIVRMLIPHALALSLPEYSESGDNGELPPLPGPLRVVELWRAELRQLRIKSIKRHDITMQRNPTSLYDFGRIFYVHFRHMRSCPTYRWVETMELCELHHL